MTEKTALITGGSRGLGLALTRSLAADGWRLIIDGRDADALAEAAAGLGDRVTAIPGDVADPAHRDQLVEAGLAGMDVVVHNASVLGPSPQPPLADYPLDVLRHVYEVNVVAPIALTQSLLPHLLDGARIVAVTSDAAAEPYEGWGGYGSSKAALEQAFAILAAERPDLRVYRADPGDMNTRMHQEAFPGEDISDRPPPSDSVPGLRVLLEGDLPSGRYAVKSLKAAPDSSAPGVPAGARS